ncbi:hypothetical protein O3G_MSEX011001 [Manduca sexta]|uniref:RNase H type-1 domain-containing protein n=1 Tax=Manduca sexta TaxID=7130 RepID=A0A921ZIP1_MANSE|nr:hypothetical protein O3G_MSEX011001 [Manduca sexta]
MQRPKKTYEYNCLKFDIIIELSEKYHDWHVIYTDGSKSDHGQGAAYYDSSALAGSNRQGIFKIIGCVSIMYLELIAISEALSYIIIRKSRKVVICSDSKSALLHIARCASECRGTSIAYVILSKIFDILAAGIELKLQWIPSHIGLRGNEKADCRAKQGIFEGMELTIEPNYTDLFPKYKNRCHLLWKEHFDSRSKLKGIWYKSIV